MSESLKLIHILTSNRWGGIQRYALDICSHFHHKGWGVCAITRGAKAIDDLFEKDGIPLLNAPLEGMLDFSSIRLLTHTLSGSRSQVIIHAHGFRNALTAIAAKKISGNKDVRIIVTRHKVRRGADSWLFRKVYRNIDAIVFVSRTARDRFIETWYKRKLPFPASKMHVVHNSINFETPEYTSPPETGPLTAMFHGPLIPGKGLETLIDALSLLKGRRIRLRIVGSGLPDYVDRIRRRAISRGVMELIDWHKHTDNPLSLIMQSDFGVLPSIEEEAFGLANIEYMAMGRPQICSSNGAQPEYITDGREGFLIPPGNSFFLAETIKKLASDPELRKRMGRRAFETFHERLAWNDFIKKLSRIYEGTDETQSPVT